MGRPGPALITHAAIQDRGGRGFRAAPAFPLHFGHMTVEQMLRSQAARTGENGLTFGLAGKEPDWLPLERLVGTVPAALVPRLGQCAVYFVPWLVKQRRGVSIALEPKAAEEERTELCHHLDFRNQGALAIISYEFFAQDLYGLAMEFYDKIAYIAAMQPPPRDDFQQLLAEQWPQTPAGEVTPDAWDWRRQVKGGEGAPQREGEAWQNYLRTAETDSLGLYMGALFMDIYYEDLFDGSDEQPPLPPDPMQQRLRALEKLYPPNRGQMLEIYRQRERHRHR